MTGELVSSAAVRLASTAYATGVDDARGSEPVTPTYCASPIWASHRSLAPCPASAAVVAACCCVKSASFRLASNEPSSDEL